PRSAEDEITSIQGSTRLEAKKQRRREGREAGRRRAPIVSEAEFLARRESVDRVMVIRQRDELTQIGVLEDKVLVEHYVARESQTSLIGNVYLGRVQNVLPSMEAAFIDIGRGRNAVLYAGEVNWSALGHKDGQPRKIESVLSSGQSILVQVTKDPIGHKGARLTSQVSLAGRFLVYVPDGTTSGISRKLPDTERNRLKTLLKEIVPDTAGVIVRTAAEGASEDELTRDVERLKARWEDIDGKAKGQAPQLLYGEPDLTLKVVRDLFTEDFKKLVIQGEDAWTSVQDYVAHVAPDLQERVQRYESDNGQDIFAAYRVEEQIAKGLDRKVWLPSGGSLVIDRTEAMTVVDVNTGKFTGSGGNLEETVTKNNLEAAEEIVRQLRLRDIGGIIVVDFIDMVLESNRDLVLRRMVECLGRDRTRHQVAEVTSLGLVQMTRKRIGTGLLEAFSENCEHCQGRGVVIHEQPVAPRSSDDAPRSSGGGRRSRGGGGGGGGGRGRGQDDQAPSTPKVVPSPKDVAAMAKPENAAPVDDEEAFEPLESVEPVEALEPAAEEVAPDVTPEVTPDVTPEPTPDVTAAEPEAPKVVKRTRRTTRSTATISTTPAEMPVVVPAAAPAPAEAVAEVVAEVVAVTAPEPPKVVTRTRGRRTPSRDPETSTPETGTDEADADASGSVVGHVPVKKRGARKR
ncbi:MAG: Rne/Rng family ribonuclease, partial [Nocardioides sp.]